jgi:anaphase-promoting complex subunit 1
VRDGLNLISISLSMIVAGSGDIQVLRRLRYAFGMYNPPVRYGTHVAIHMSIGLLFLGSGRFTLGTSDAAIAAMVTAFFPRFNQVSSDNKSYLQALRHLWVLAVEPRCLVARDVDTKEVVFLPVKIKLKEGTETGTAQLVMPTLVPDIDKIQSLRVDTPRYWPFYIDIVNLPHHKEALLKNQTLFVKRRTAFLSYMEDPKGSRSLFVRSGSSAGDAAVLDFPQLKNTSTHPATDLHHFISSYSNDPFFLAFADFFCREESQTDEEKLFFAYCYAALHDSILQDKPRTVQTHLTLYRYRQMSPQSPDMVLAHQDLKFAHEFYSKIYDRRFSGRAENNPRPALLRESSLRSALHELEAKLEALHVQPAFTSLLRRYARGLEIPPFEPGSASFDMSRALAWYLQRNSIPTASVLLVLSSLADNSRNRCLQQPPPQGTTASAVLEEGIKEVVQKAGSQLTTSLGSGWSLRCVEEIMAAWEKGKANAAMSDIVAK